MPGLPPRFPPGFFDRQDPSPDPVFYALPRLVTHLDEAAITAVGDLYDELNLAGGCALDLMSSWVSHFHTAPRLLTALGLNAAELDANPQATDRVVHDLNADPVLPFADASFDCAVCCVSVDYLIRPIEVFAEVARVLRPGAPFVTTFSNRCFPSKAVRGWLDSDDAGRCEIVAAYFRATGKYAEPRIQLRTAPGVGDPLYAVWATRTP